MNVIFNILVHVKYIKSYGHALNKRSDNFRDYQEHKTKW